MCVVGLVGSGCFVSTEDAKDMYALEEICR